ncbi:homoserine kinase-like protein [Tanacetum coccineum]
MKMLNLKSVKMSLSLEKGLPLRSGLGSSAASAAADAAKVSGYHADNIAPAIMGSFVWCEERGFITHEDERPSNDD